MKFNTAHVAFNKKNKNKNYSFQQTKKQLKFIAKKQCQNLNLLIFATTSIKKKDTILQSPQVMTNYLGLLQEF